MTRWQRWQRWQRLSLLEKIVTALFGVPLLAGILLFIAPLLIVWGCIYGLVNAIDCLVGDD